MAIEPESQDRLFFAIHFCFRGLDFTIGMFRGIFHVRGSGFLNSGIYGVGVQDGIRTGSFCWRGMEGGFSVQS